MCFPMNQPGAGVRPGGRQEGDAAAPGTQWSGAGHSAGGRDSF